MLVLLCREKITFLSYRRFATNMSFFIRKSIDLWNKMDFERYVWKDQTACLELHSTYFFFFKDSFQSKSYSFFASESGSLEPMTRLIVTSNVFGLQCIIDIDYSALAA